MISKNNFKKNKKYILNIFKSLFILAITLTIIQQFPLIKENLYDEIRLLLYLILVILILYSLSKLNVLLKFPFFIFFTIVTFFTSLFYILLFISGNEINIFELLIPYGIFLTAISLNFSHNELKFFLNYYILLSLLMGFANVFYYVGGIQITQLYEIPLKNQIGPILGISTIIAGVSVFNSKNANIKIRIFYIICFTLLFICLLIMRNRASLFAIIIVISLALILQITSKMTIKRILFLICLSILFLCISFSGLLNSVVGFIWESLTLNYDITNFDSLSAGRTDIYLDAVKFIANYPIIGELGNLTGFYETPHNFILNKWVSFGIIGSIPIVILYLYLYIFTFKGFCSQKENADLIFWLMLFSLLISQFEYTYPFGPGVSQLFLWFMFGQYIKKQENSYLKRI